MISLEDYLTRPVAIQSELRALFGNEKDLVIFDIGACEGEDSIRYSRLFPQSRVFAFEPRQDNLEKLHSNLKQYRAENRVTVLPFALSEQEGTSTFFLSSGQPEGVEQGSGWDYGNKSSSLLPPAEEARQHPAWLKFDKQIEVSTRRFDSVCREHGLEKIHFIHLDVQGAELMVLKGAGELLNQTVAVWMEVEEVELYRGQPLRREVEQFMSEHGFSKTFSKMDSVSGDQFYVRMNLLDFRARMGLSIAQARKRYLAVRRKIAQRILRQFR